MSNKIGRTPEIVDRKEMEKNIRDKNPNDKEVANAIISFSNKLNDAIESRGLTLEEACKRFKINSNSTLTNYRRGLRVPPIETMIKISKALNCSIDYLLGYTNLKSTDENYKMINDVTGLSDEAIFFLKEEKKKFQTSTKQNNYYNYKTIETLNFILENEHSAKLLKNISDFLWVSKNLKNQLKRNIDNNKNNQSAKNNWIILNNEMDRCLATSKVKIDKILFKMEDEIRNLKELLKEDWLQDYREEIEKTIILNDLNK